VPTEIPWLKYAAMRLALGLCGIIAGLVMALICVTVWHWFWLFIFYTFLDHPRNPAYGMDALLLILLFWEGYRYKQRMPPPNPFTNADRIVCFAVTGHHPYTPHQAAHGIAEMLYVAPRLFFWGMKQLSHIALPNEEVAQVAQELLTHLHGPRLWVPFNELAQQTTSPRAAAQALALLIRAQLANARFEDGELAVCKWEMEWV
jgi:hypothetical protein